MLGHEPLQPSTVPVIEHVQQVSSAPHTGDECELVVVVQRRGFKPDQNAGRHPGRVVPGERYGPQPFGTREKNSLGRPPTRDLGRNLVDWVLGCAMVYLALFGLGRLLMGPAWKGTVLLLGSGICAAALYADISRRWGVETAEKSSTEAEVLS